VQTYTERGAPARRRFMLCGARAADGAGSSRLNGERRSFGEDARDAPHGREGKGAQAGQGQGASFASAGQLGSEEERLRRATDSRPSDLQGIDDAFAEHPCAVLHGPLLLLLPGTLFVSEHQVCSLHRAELRIVRGTRHPSDSASNVPGGSTGSAPA